MIEIEIPAQDSWGDSVVAYFHNSYIPRIYYFVAMDCEHNTHMRYRLMPKIEVDFNIVSQLDEGE